MTCDVTSVSLVAWTMYIRWVPLNLEEEEEEEREKGEVEEEEHCLSGLMGLWLRQ